MNMVNEIMQHMKGYSFPYYFTTMCNLGFFDILFDTTLSLSQMAKKVSLSESLLIRLLRPLCSLKLITIDDSFISLTEEGKLFCAKNEINLLPKINFHEKEGMFFWQKFEEKIRTVQNDQEEANNRFIEFSENLDKSDVFIKMMDSVSSNVDISKIVLNRVSREDKCFVDIGGGVGTLTLNVLNQITWLSGKVYDLPHLKTAATLKMQERNMEKRCEFISGDFFKSVPQGDFYILSRVLHDWSDKDCCIILGNIALQMRNQQKLFVVEKVLPGEDNGKLEDYMMDLNVYCMCGGQERTIGEFEKMFLNNGLYITQVFDIEESSLLKCIEVGKL